MIMAGSFPLDNMWSNWPLCLAAFVGLALAGVCLLVGTAWQRGRRAVPPAETDEADSFGDPFEVGSASERRTASRRMGRHVRIYVSDAAAEATPVEGWVLDRSLGGLCISLGRQMPPDTILSIRAYNASDTIPWAQVRVLRCESQGNHFQLGCQFIRTPPFNAMMLFG